MCIRYLLAPSVFTRYTCTGQRGFLHPWLLCTRSIWLCHTLGFYHVRVISVWPVSLTNYIYSKRRAKLVSRCYQTTYEWPDSRNQALISRYTVRTYMILYRYIHSWYTYKSLHINRLQELRVMLGVTINVKSDVSCHPIP